MRPFLVALTGAAAGATCFPESIGASERRNLVKDGKSFPVGFWSTAFDDYGQTSFAATAMVQLVTEELLGFNTTVMGTGTWEIEGLYRLLGCADRSCAGSRRHDTHVMVDAYVDPDEWERVLEDPHAPVNVGSMGYDFLDAQFVSPLAFATAAAANSIPLDSHLGLDVRRQPWRHFDPIAAVEKSRLGSCENLFLNFSAFGDQDELATSCPDGYFWLSPACRTNSSQCIPYFSPFSGWLDPIVVHKAIMWNIPLAVAGSNDLNSFEDLVTKHRCVFSWQRPSSRFGSAHHIRFPAHDNQQWKVLRNYSTAEPRFPISNVVSRDLKFLAPELFRLVAQLRIDAQTMNVLLEEQNRTNSSWRDVACQFLTSNPSFLKNWWTWSSDSTSTTGDVQELTTGPVSLSTVDGSTSTTGDVQELTTGPVSLSTVDDSISTTGDPQGSTTGPVWLSTVGKSTSKLDASEFGESAFTGRQKAEKSTEAFLGGAVELRTLPFWASLLGLAIQS